MVGELRDEGLILGIILSGGGDESGSLALLAHAQGAEDGGHRRRNGLALGRLDETPGTPLRAVRGPGLVASPPPADQGCRRLWKGQI